MMKGILCAILGLVVLTSCSSPPPPTPQVVYKCATLYDWSPAQEHQLAQELRDKGVKSQDMIAQAVLDWRRMRKESMACSHSALRQSLPPLSLVVVPQAEGE